MKNTTNFYVLSSLRPKAWFKLKKTTKRLFLSSVCSTFCSTLDAQRFSFSYFQPRSTLPELMLGINNEQLEASIARSNLTSNLIISPEDLQQGWNEQMEDERKTVLQPITEIAAQDYHAIKKIMNYSGLKTNNPQQYQKTLLRVSGYTMVSMIRRGAPMLSLAALSLWSLLRKQENPSCQ